MNGITTERTSIRDAPGGNALGILQANTNIVFVQEGNWARLGGSKTGYVNMRSVKILPSDPNIPPSPPPSFPKVVHTILIDDQGRISLDGLPYE